MITSLDDIQPGLAEMAAAIFNGDTKTCRVHEEGDFYKSRYNRFHYLQGSIMNYFG